MRHWLKVRLYLGRDEGDATNHRVGAARARSQMACAEDARREINDARDSHHGAKVSDHLLRPFTIFAFWQSPRGLALGHHKGDEPCVGLRGHFATIGEVEATQVGAIAALFLIQAIAARLVHSAALRPFDVRVVDRERTHAKVVRLQRA